MFRFVTHKMTALSNNYVDWSRSADLLRSGNFKYNAEQVLVRGAMVFTTAVSAYLGAYFNDQEKTNCSNTTAAIAAGALGLLVSHVYVVAPLVYKRYKASQECKQLVEEIKENAIPGLSDPINKVIDDILKLTLATENRSNASLTWGHRKRLLNNLLNGLVNEDVHLIAALNTGDAESIMRVIENEPESASKLKLR